MAFSKHFIKLIKVNYLGWLAYFAVYNVYAVFWRQYAPGDGYSYLTSIIWFAKEWAGWLLLSPVILWWLESPRNKLSIWLNFSVVCLLSLILTLLIRVQLNFGEYPPDIMVTIVTMLPKYLPAYFVIFGAWYILSRHSVLLSLSQVPPQVETGNKEPEITVEHQGLFLALKLNQIYCLKAAGNYIEIVCLENTYLKRGTLSQILKELPQSGFVQVHRSYAINISKLVKLTNAENGGGIATLSNQQAVPVSKRYKPELKSIEIPARESAKPGADLD